MFICGGTSSKDLFEKESYFDDLFMLDLKTFH
jgi:hypothetical protein